MEKVIITSNIDIAIACNGHAFANDGWAKTCSKDEFDEYAQRLSQASVLIADALINELNKER